MVGTPIISPENSQEILDTTFIDICVGTTFIDTNIDSSVDTNIDSSVYSKFLDRKFLDRKHDVMKYGHHTISDSISLSRKKNAKRMLSIDAFEEELFEVFEEDLKSGKDPLYLFEHFILSFSDDTNFLWNHIYKQYVKWNRKRFERCIYYTDEEFDIVLKAYEFFMSNRIMKPKNLYIFLQGFFPPEKKIYTKPSRSESLFIKVIELFDNNLEINWSNYYIKPEFLVGYKKSCKLLISKGSKISYDLYNAKSNIRFIDIVPEDQYIDLVIRSFFDRVIPDKTRYREFCIVTCKFLDEIKYNQELYRNSMKLILSRTYSGCKKMDQGKKEKKEKTGKKLNITKK